MPASGPSSSDVLRRGNEFLRMYPRHSAAWRALSRVTILATGLISKAFVKGWHRTTVHNKAAFDRAVAQARAEKRGLLTVMNHVSILDDPLVWGGTLSVAALARPRRMRWTLGAKDICFKSRAESVFFSLGQTLSVERFGRGPDQPALDAAVALVAQGRWVHMFPEGFVHQPYEPHDGSLRYFHWGVSRVVLEPPGTKPPIVVPVYGKGLQAVFPEDKVKRTFGYGSRSPITYAFGDPLSSDRLSEYRARWQAGRENVLALRSEVANFVRDGVLAVKRDYFPAEYARDMADDLRERLATADFWKSQTLVKLKGLSMVEKRVKGSDK